MFASDANCKFWHSNIGTVAERQCPQIKLLADIFLFDLS